MAEKNTALDFVLNFEAQGADAYLKLASRTRNKLGKKLFYSLAAEEVQHARKADEFYSGISKPGILAPSVTASLEVMIKEFFNGMGKAEFSEGKENTEGYQLAMELEKKGYEAYNNFLKAANTDDERNFFKWILNEEKEHLDAIANVYTYLTGTADWLQGDESRTWNWMNS